jgi:hypothetical protein
MADAAASRWGFIGDASDDDDVEIEAVPAAAAPVPAPPAFVDVRPDKTAGEDPGPAAEVGPEDMMGNPCRIGGIVVARKGPKLMPCFVKAYDGQYLHTTRIERHDGTSWRRVARSQDVLLVPADVAVVATPRQLMRIKM